MFCKNCGKEIPDDVSFCPECGEKIDSTSTAAAETVVPEAGAPVAAAEPAAASASAESAVPNTAAEPVATAASATPPASPKARRLSRKTLVIIACALVACAAVVIGVFAFTSATPGKIDSKNFPDQEFRFCVETYDANSDGTLSSDEIDSVTSLDVSDKGIQDLTGVQEFTALQYFDASDNQLSKAVDMTENKSLVSVDVSGNSGLPSLKLPSGVDSTKVKADESVSVDIGGKKLATVTYSYTTQYVGSGSGTNQSSYSYPEFTCSTSSAAVDALNEQLKADVTDRQSKAYSAANASLDQYTGDTYQVAYFKNGIVSLRKDESQYAGGPHGTETVTGLTVNLQTGETLSPESVIGISKTDLENDTKTKVLQILGNSKISSSVYSKASSGMSTALQKGTISWYLSDDGIVACVPSYTIGDYSMGHPELTVVDSKGKLSSATSLFEATAKTKNFTTSGSMKVRTIA